MLFVIPQCDNKTVSIAQEYLDRAPESVLAIAAQRATPNSTVSLKDWPDANVAVLQARVMTEPMPGNSLFEPLKHSLPTSSCWCNMRVVIYARTIAHTHVYTGRDRLPFWPQHACVHQHSGESAAPSSGVLQSSQVYVAVGVVYQA